MNKKKYFVIFGVCAFSICAFTKDNRPALTDEACDKAVEDLRAKGLYPDDEQEKGKEDYRKKAFYLNFALKNIKSIPEFNGSSKTFIKSLFFLSRVRLKEWRKLIERDNKNFEKFFADLNDVNQEIKTAVLEVAKKYRIRRPSLKNIIKTMEEAKEAGRVSLFNL